MKTNYIPTPPNAILLVPSHMPETIQPENGTDFKLSELYRRLRCDMIEIARSHMNGSLGQEAQNYILIIDEEGKLKNSDINWRATEWFSHPRDVIVGRAILCHSSMLK